MREIDDKTDNKIVDNMKYRGYTSIIFKIAC